MTMKKRKKNNRLSFLTAIVCLLLFAGVLFLGMKNYEPEKSENPVQGVNSESSLKGYLGKGYAYAGRRTARCCSWSAWAWPPRSPVARRYGTRPPR